MEGVGEEEVLKFNDNVLSRCISGRESAARGAGLNKSQLKPPYIGITEKPERGNNAERGTKG